MDITQERQQLFAQALGLARHLARRAVPAKTISEMEVAIRQSFPGADDVLVEAVLLSGYMVGGRSYRVRSREIVTDEDNLVTHQTCSRCKELLPRDMFWKARSARTGLHSTCKKCLQARNPERKIYPKVKSRVRDLSCEDCGKQVSYNTEYAARLTGRPRRCQTCAGIARRKADTDEPRTCPRCGQVKARSDFYTNRTKDGRPFAYSHCIACHKAINEIRRRARGVPTREEWAESRKGLTRTRIVDRFAEEIWHSTPKTT